MKRHGVVLDLPAEKLYFYWGYCDHVGAPGFGEGHSHKQVKESDTPLAIKEAGTRPDKKKRKNHRAKKKPKEPVTTKPEQPLEIAQIRAALFYTLAKRCKYKLFSISLVQLNPEGPLYWKSGLRPKVEDTVPKELQDLADFFLEKKADEVPKFKLTDFKFDLTREPKPLYCLLYNMS